MSSAERPFNLSDIGISAEELAQAFETLAGELHKANSLARQGRWKEFEQCLDSMSDGELDKFIELGSKINQ